MRGVGRTIWGQDAGDAGGNVTEQTSRPPLRDPYAPFALQLEWLANRYNPGYYLGGTIRPELRMAALGWHAKRLAGALAFFVGVEGLASAALLHVVARTLPDPWSLGFGVLNVLVGVRLWKAAGPQAPGAGDGDRAGLSEALRVAAMVVLGVVLMAAISIVTITAVAVAWAAARGNVGFVGAIAVLIAIVAVRRATRRPTRRCT